MSGDFSIALSKTEIPIEEITKIYSNVEIARIYLDGVTKIKGMYSKKTYTADEAGWFDIEFDKYQTEIFEYEQADYKSSHAELKRFGLSGCVTADSEGEAYFIIPEGIEKAEYKAAVSDYAKVYINGVESVVELNNGVYEATLTPGQGIFVIPYIA